MTGAPEPWTLWAEEPRRWGDALDAIAAGILPVVTRRWPEVPGVELLPARWDLPGFQVLIPPGAPGTPADGAWRAVQVFVEPSPSADEVQFGGAAWVDERAPDPRVPSTRHWCHTTTEAEARWAFRLDGEPLTPRAVEERFARVVDVIGGWRWDATRHAWEGDDLEAEEPVVLAA